MWRLLSFLQNMSQLSIPGTGWDTESVVSGFIKLNVHALAEESMNIIDNFNYDDTYPFTNIFSGISTANYGFYIIGFAGSYKQIEEDWNEWLWRFSQLLTRLDAVEAVVNLNCILGNYRWKLEPKARFENLRATDSMSGQVWGITEAPQPDFSTDPKWLEHCLWLGCNNWTRLVERWNRPN